MTFFFRILVKKKKCYKDERKLLQQFAKPALSWNFHRFHIREQRKRGRADAGRAKLCKLRISVRPDGHPPHSSDGLVQGGQRPGRILQSPNGQDSCSGTKSGAARQDCPARASCLASPPRCSTLLSRVAAARAEAPGLPGTGFVQPCLRAAASP